MRLEMAEFPVKEVRFTHKTSYNRGVLEVNKEEITELILQDSRIISADAEIALPGEKARIVNCREAVEPRIKVAGRGCVFPGIMGPVETVGEGKTNRMPGLTVISSAEYKATIMSGTGSGSSAILDMWGPGAEVTPFASTINIVLILKLIEEITEWDAHSAIQLAVFKIAHRLAETTRDKVAENTEVFQLSPVDPSLPRVVYILCASTGAGTVHPGFALYGRPVDEILPTLMHPNELFDGALTADGRRGNGVFPQTWFFMNAPVVTQLMREHGKRLNFVGFIIERTGFPDELGKQIAAATTSQIARLLGAEDAIMTRLLVGNSFIDVMLTIKACKEKGINAVLVTPERGGAVGTDLPLIFYVPEAEAMVSTGSLDREITLPRPDRVIGVKRGELAKLYPGDAPYDPWAEYVADAGLRDVSGGIDWFGNMKYTCDNY